MFSGNFGFLLHGHTTARNECFINKMQSRPPKKVRNRNFTIVRIPTTDISDINVRAQTYVLPNSCPKQDPVCTYNCIYSFQNQYNCTIV